MASSHTKVCWQAHLEEREGVEAEGIGDKVDRRGRQETRQKRGAPPPRILNLRKQD